MLPDLLSDIKLKNYQTFISIEEPTNDVVIDLQPGLMTQVQRLSTPNQADNAGEKHEDILFYLSELRRSIR